MGFVSSSAAALLLFAGIGTPFLPASAEDDDWSGHGTDFIARLERIGFITYSFGHNPREYWYTADCYLADETRVLIDCVGGVVQNPNPQCTADVWVEPRWSRIRDVDGDPATDDPGPWILEAGYTCPGDADFPISVVDIRRLPVAPASLELQPPNGWVLAGLDTIAYSDASDQGFAIELLGIPFQVGVLPTSFSWDFGDGSAPIITDDPGQPWPDHTVAHRYTAAGPATPVLTTEWSGYYRRSALEEWLEIDGTVSTTTTGPALTVHTARTRLVEDPLS